LPIINGKKDFVKAMETMESVIGGFSNTTIKNVIAESEFVVLESFGRDASEENCSLFYCDVYRLKGENIQELTTYVVDITLNEDAKS